MKLRFAAILGLLWLVAPALAACGSDAPQPPLRVVATLAPLADWARQVGRERVVVTQIVPVDVDPRAYTPTAGDVAAVRDADVLISNGLGLEPWLPNLIAQAQPRDVIALELAQFIGPRAPRRQLPDQSARHNDDADPGVLHPESGSAVAQPVAHSPFLWLDPGPDRAQLAVLLIGDTLTRVDPDHLAWYRRNAERYNGELENLDAWVQRQISRWPRLTVGQRSIAALQAPNRAWHYFAERYGLELRLTSELATRHPILPANTPLFVNAFGADIEAAPGNAATRPAGVLRPLGYASYVQLIRQNVLIMTSGAHRAMRELDRPWIRSNES